MTEAFAFGYPHMLGADELVALLGGKGANLAVMTRKLGLPVPPGFTITTQTCNEYLAGGWPSGLDAEIDRQLGLLERRVGRQLGDPADPLLVSVRSGAPVSMPGMMDTILNLGLNRETVEGLADVAADTVFAEDCQRRFEEMFRETVGVDDVPDDPRQQLGAAIEAVFGSWNGERARKYRDIEHIDHRLGTAVNVQAMVFGNRGPDSATGVLFTRDPSTGEAAPFGDVLFDAQGEDVVDGRHHTQPISALVERLPGVAEELWRAADILERHHRDLCDIEFTVEQGRLWLLQVRVGKRSPHAALRIALEMAEADDFPLDRREAVERVTAHLADPPHLPLASPGMPPLTQGLAASPGVASGEIVTTPDAAVAAAAEGRPVVLVRSETSPADVHGMAEAAGILTARGGLASHAAVVARGWGIPAVVGARSVAVGPAEVTIAGSTLRPGDAITIDGSTGHVFAGAVEHASEIIPEAAVLLRWADELGVDLAGDAEAEAEPDEPLDTDHDHVVVVLAIKGFVTAGALGSVLLAGADRAAQLVEQLTSRGLVETAGTMLRLSADGIGRSQALLAADQAAWGIDRAVDALDSFLPLDVRMKRIVTGWQVRSVGGEEVLNDHSDDAYDRGVLDELAELQEETGPWLADIAAGLARLDRYRRRLDRALGEALGGDDRYVAAPMVDSYHNVWFELHEDLIRLANRTRAEEAAAGRA